MSVARCSVLGCECGCHRAKRRQAPRLWTPEMDREVRAAVEHGEHPHAIAARMYLTVDSIKWRIKTLGLSLRDGWRSRQEVAAALGVGRRAVDRWAHDGRLCVTRHGTRWTRISDADLRAFVDGYAGTAFEPSTVTDAALRRRAETASLANRRRLAS